MGLPVDCFAAVDGKIEWLDEMLWIDLRRECRKLNMFLTMRASQSNCARRIYHFDNTKRPTFFWHLELFKLNTLICQPLQMLDSVESNQCAGRRTRQSKCPWTRQVSQKTARRAHKLTEGSSTAKYANLGTTYQWHEGCQPPHNDSRPTEFPRWTPKSKELKIL